jgi:hypothetical protein
MSEIQLPSNRSFGFLFTVVFALISGWFAWKGSAHWWWFASASGTFLLVTLIAPGILKPLNIVWMKFGALLNRIVSPIMLGAIYFIVITPVALFFKVTGRDELKRKFDGALKTYWISRAPPGPDGPSSFPRQF